MTGVTSPQVKRGEIPEISLRPQSFMGIPEYKLDPVYLVELGIIGAALLGASLASYLLQACISWPALRTSCVTRIMQDTCR